MLKKLDGVLGNYLPGWNMLRRLPRQLLFLNPFDGDCRPERVPLCKPFAGRPALPVPHPWNYREPIRILDTFFWDTERLAGSQRHTRYFEFPGFPPVLVTRDPGIIRAITTATGDSPGQFDRDTLPSTGIARATGKDTLLYSNGSIWRTQRKLAASPFGKTTLFQPEKFQEFAATFRQTVLKRLDVLEQHLAASGKRSLTVAMEPEIKAVMLEMLTNNFFGTAIPYEQIRGEYVPAIERMIDHIVRDTVINKLGIPIQRWPSMTRGSRKRKATLPVSKT